MSNAVTPVDGAWASMNPQGRLGSGAYLLSLCRRKCFGVNSVSLRLNFPI